MEKQNSIKITTTSKQKNIFKLTQLKLVFPDDGATLKGGRARPLDGS
jgi:hypothetical protein